VDGEPDTAYIHSYHCRLYSNTDRLVGRYVTISRVSSPVEYVKEAPLATLWLNRPEARNAFDIPLLRALRRGLAKADRDPEVRAIVVRGRGDSFCVGADLSLLESGSSWIELSRFVARTYDGLSESRKVTIAAVHGLAVAGGFEMMLACDFAVAAEDARIGDGHIRNGLYGSAGPIHRLPRMIGSRRANELLLSGDLLSGREAMEWGLVNAVALAGELDAAVVRFAVRFTDKSPTVTWLTKLVAGRGLEADVETLKVLEQVTSGVVAELADAREGRDALRAGRKPVWQPLQAPLDDE
jgi:enoyl-CoA hydratase